MAAAFSEFLWYDSLAARKIIGRALYTVVSIVRAARLRRVQAFQMLMRLHSFGFSRQLNDRIERDICQAHAAERQGIRTGLWETYDVTIDTAVANYRRAPITKRLKLIGTRVLVVKAAKPQERGVLVVDYSYVFPLLAGLFNISKIADKYFIVLEPSWRGACAPEIMLYTRLDSPVFVETIEPYDHRLLASLKSNLHTIPTAANHWVDYRTAPVLNGIRDIDVIMVASWSRIKRHRRFFQALAELRRRGHRLRVALVGYRHDLSAADVMNYARYYGIHNQIELFERLSQSEVHALLWRSKVHVLWSRTECANRAIIEAMLADVPVIVREGLTYGYRYPYINPQTGRFADEGTLPDAILETLDKKGAYNPRDWVLEHMTCRQATMTMEATIRARATELGERWSEGLVLRTSGLDTQRYWDPADRERFEKDYVFLESALVS